MAPTLLLAGDVGGTKTLVGLYSPGHRRPTPIQVEEFTTADFESLDAVVAAFMMQRGRTSPPVSVACFGVAGPVVDEVAELVNIPFPWAADARTLARRFAIPTVMLINDLAAMAHAVPVLEPDELATIQEGRRVPTGNAAVIAAGTGMGQGLLHYVDGRLVPSPSEGGHADFAARTPREFELVMELTRQFGRTDVERVVSGPGLINLFRFTHPSPCSVVDETSDPSVLPSLISASALENRCAACREALDLFVSAYGAEAGNLALRSVSTGGLYLGGGISPKILPALTTGAFVDAFRAKTPMEDLLRDIPIQVILNTRAGLLGAAVRANEIAMSR